MTAAAAHTVSSEQEAREPLRSTRRTASVRVREHDTLGSPVEPEVYCSSAKSSAPRRQLRPAPVATALDSINAVAVTTPSSDTTPRLEKILATALGLAERDQQARARVGQDRRFRPAYSSMRSARNGG